MTKAEARVRSVTAAHRQLVARAIDLVSAHCRAISTDLWASKPDIADDDGACLTIDGDVATLHYTADGCDADYAASFNFDARCLWSKAAIIEAEQRLVVREAAEQAVEAARQQARDRAVYERLRRKFEPSDLRTDLRKAMEIAERIAVEDGLPTPAWVAPAAD